MSLSRYEVLGIVGEGAYGMVLKCRNNETGEIVAVKKFKEGEDDEMVRKTIVREVKTLRALQHENIVRLREAFKRKGKLYMVFEFLEKNLLEVLDDTPDGLPANAVRCYIFQLLKAIAFCHHRSIIHRDIKPENLLISRSCDPLQNALPALGAGILKLCDFGFARQLQGQPADLTDYVSTRWYRAPELLVGMPYSFPVDVWAVGCIMGELTDGQPLFPGESDIDQLYVIQRVAGAVPQAMAQAFAANPRYKGLTMPAPSQEGNLADRYATLMPPEGRDLLAKLLAMDPAERPTGQEALQHPYFAPIHAASAIHSGVPSGKSAALEALKAGAFHGRDARHRDHGHGHGKGKGKRARSKDLAQDSVTTQAVAACGAGRDAGEVTSSARRAAEDAASDAGGAAAAAGREERSERGERTEEVTPRESVAGAAAAVLASQGLYSHGSSGVVSRPISVEARRGMHLGGKGGGGNPLVRQAGQQRSGAGAGGGKTRKRDKVSPPVSSGRLQPGQKRQMAMEVAPTEPGPSQASSHAAPALGPLPDSVRGWGQGREEDGVGGGLRGAGGKGKGVEGAQGSGSGHGMAHLPGWRGGGAEGDGGAGPGPGSDVRIGMSGWGSRGGFGRPVLAGIPRANSGQAASEGLGESYGSHVGHMGRHASNASDTSPYHPHGHVLTPLASVREAPGLDRGHGGNSGMSGPGGPLAPLGHTGSLGGGIGKGVGGMGVGSGIGSGMGVATAGGGLSGIRSRGHSRGHY